MTENIIDIIYSARWNGCEREHFEWLGTFNKNDNNN